MTPLKRILPPLRKWGYCLKKLYHIYYPKSMKTRSWQDEFKGKSGKANFNGIFLETNLGPEEIIYNQKAKDCDCLGKDKSKNHCQQNLGGC